MNRLLLVGLNHTTAPLAVREKLAGASAQTMAAVRSAWENCEAVLLGTCNRVELYLAGSGSPDADAAIELLARAHGLDPSVVQPHVYAFSGQQAIEHLFNVASGLDSMVLGETQILGQVRNAYESARVTGAAGPVLHPLFQKAVAVGKEVLGQSGLADGRLSVASVAVDYARRVFDHFGDKTVLCVGAGKMARLVSQRFTDLRPGRLEVISRDIGRARVLADEFGGRGYDFSSLDERLVAADVVITSTGADFPVITRARFEPLLGRRRYRPVLMIDIAVPRDIETAVGELDNVYVYNLDDLQEVVQKTLAGRGNAVAAARAIVARHVAQYAAWHRQRETGPLIDGLYKQYNTIAKAELDRALAKLPSMDDAARKALEEMTHRMVQKMLHGPVHCLRGNNHEATAGYAHALEKLFGVGTHPPPDDAAGGESK